MAAPTITEKFRGSVGGRAWRVYEFTHTGAATTTITAGSLDLTYIDIIAGSNTPVPVQATPGSIWCGMGVSIGANNDSLIWVSTVACVQTVTIIGW